METMKPVSPWMTYGQAEEYTSLERTTLYRAVRRGELKAGGTSRAIRFHKADLDEWMQSGSRGRI